MPFSLRLPLVGHLHRQLAVGIFAAAGKRKKAAEVLELIWEGMISPDNESDKGYYDLLMLYKGLRTPEEILDKLEEEPLTASQITACYGAANYHRFVCKDPEKADKLLRWLVEKSDPVWHGAFAWQAARAETNRNRHLKRT